MPAGLTAHLARQAVAQRVAQRNRSHDRDARIAAHLKARYPETYALIAARVDAGTDEQIAALGLLEDGE